MQLMRRNHSKLTISSFSFRMSDLWNAMLHNDFVFSFRNTHEIRSGTVLNDLISNVVDSFKILNRLEQKRICEVVRSFASVKEFRAETERILRDVNDAVNKNFSNIRTTLQEAIDAADIRAALKEKYEVYFSTLKDGELRRVNNETTKYISVHMKKLEISNDQRVKDLRDRFVHLEKCSEEVDRDRLNEIETTKIRKSWQQLIADNQTLVGERIKIKECEIADKLRGSIQRWSLKGAMQFSTFDSADIVKTPLVDNLPQVTEGDIVQSKETNIQWAMNFVISKPIGHIAHMANIRLEEACKMWELQFQNHIDFELNASYVDQVLSEAAKLLGISTEGQIEDRHDDADRHDRANEICSCLPKGYSFTSDYTIGYIKFVCNYIYNRALENSKAFISMTDPLADIGEHCIRSVNRCRLMSAEANIDAASKQIFDHAKRSFVKDLGELIKAEVCKADNKNPTFKSKRAFLRTILTDLAQKTLNLAHAKEGKEKIFKEFMLYVELGESKPSEDFFLDLIVKFLKEMLTIENTTKTDFLRMVKNHIGKAVEKAKNVMRYAEANCKGRARKYTRLFKEFMCTGDTIDLGISTLDGFTEGVLEKIDNIYADFLSQANSSFEILACEDNKAVIRPLFEKIMGCRERCPFCSASCSESLEKHTGDHRANHYPLGISGVVEVKGWFSSTLETPDATTDGQRKTRKLALDTCPTMIRSPINIRTHDTMQKYSKWYNYWFNWNYRSFKNYKEVAENTNWDIPYSGDIKTSLYWKWFMAQFDKELAEHYKTLSPEIPEAWKEFSWEEAKESLNEPDFTPHIQDSPVHPINPLKERSNKPNFTPHIQAAPFHQIPPQSGYLSSLSHYLPGAVQAIGIPHVTSSPSNALTFR